MLGRITDWKISGEESISDHSIITYGIKIKKTNKKQHKHEATEIQGELRKHRKYNKNSAEHWRLLDGCRVAKTMRTTTKLDFKKG